MVPLATERSSALDALRGMRRASSDRLGSLGKVVAVDAGVDRYTWIQEISIDARRDVFWKVWRQASTNVVHEWRCFSEGSPNIYFAAELWRVMWIEVWMTCIKWEWFQG